MFFLNKDRTQALDAVLASPAAVAAVDKRRKELASRRVQLAKERDDLERAAVSAYADHQARLTASAEAVEKAELAFRDARTAHGALVAARIDASITLAARMDEIEAELRETADGQIGDFIAEMNALWDAARRTPSVQSMTPVINANTGKRTMVEGPVLVQPVDRMRAIREAIAEAEAIRLIPDQSAVATELDRIRMALPIVGQAKG